MSSRRVCPRHRGRQSGTRISVPNSRRSHTAPPGPMLAKSVAAIAEPNWTEAIAPRTSTREGAGASRPMRREAVAV